GRMNIVGAARRISPCNRLMRSVGVASVPTRYASTRLPGKPLIEIGGKPMILRVVERAKQGASINRVIVATDDERVFQVVAGAGVETVMTSPDHATGTDRLAEVAAGLGAGTGVNVRRRPPPLGPATDPAPREPPRPH